MTHPTRYALRPLIGKTNILCRMDGAANSRMCYWGWLVTALCVGGCAERQRLNFLLDCTPDQLATAIRTPREAAEIIDMRMQHHSDPRMQASDNWQSLATSLEVGYGDCDDWAIASAALLADDGFPPKLLIVGTVRIFIDTRNHLARRGYCHAVHLLERDGLYGANGINGGDRIEPQFQAIDEVVRRLPLIQDRWEFYKVISLDGVDIINGRGNLYDQVAKQYHATKWTDVKYPPRTTAPVVRE